MYNELCENIIFTTLYDHPKKHDETISLIEKSFNYNEKNQYEVDFYPLMNKENHHHNYILLSKADDSVVGHIGINLRNLNSNDKSTLTCLIGGVALREDFQGKGIMKTFLDEVLSLHKKDVSLFLLWSNLDKFYKKFNFHQAGGVIQTTKTNTNDKSFPPDGYLRREKISDLELREIKKIYESSFENLTTFSRSEKHWRDILKISSSKLYIKKDLNNRINAYFFYEKGHDFANIIHEFGSVKKDHLENMKQLAEYCLWRPEDDNQYFDKQSYIYAGFFKIGSTHLFSDFIHNWSQEKIVITAINLNSVHFEFSGSEYILDHETFLQSVFGPNPVTEFKALGLPIYISGLDSI